MKTALKRLVTRGAEKFGYTIARKAPPPDLEPAFLETYVKCAQHSMTSIERMYGLYSAVNYLVDEQVPGDFVECGVWQGGSAMMMAHALGMRQAERRIWLYDTFAGMTEPTDADRDFAGRGAMGKWQDKQSERGNEWCRAGIEVVRRNMASTGISESAVRLVEGPVESTLLGELPETIALLRLDTDWYESTKMELEMLYPRLAVGGVIIIDDYGHWQGARKAVDEYFAKPDVAAPLLNRMDYTGPHRRAHRLTPVARSLSVVIPTYRRGRVVVDTIRHLRRQVPPPLEILVVDQTQDHPTDVARDLGKLASEGEIAWHRLTEPSIPAAMNHGLLAAKADCVLFLDDDIEPCAGLVQRHLDAQAEASLVAGQVLQPGQQAEPLAAGEEFRFNSPSPAWIKEFMGGNFSVDRARALSLGGFDQNFVGAAYRFEAEFAHRFVREFGLIRYEPAAAIRHLAISTGGTRAHGHHLTTMSPGHSVGAYYYLLKTRKPGWFGEALWRPIRAVRTRHHLRRPWWIPATLLAEIRGLLLARRLLRSGPRLIDVRSRPGAG